MNCPLNKRECPEHNKKGGCSFWLEVIEGENVVASIKGCTFVVTPMLLVKSINMSSSIAKETNCVSSELSALRMEIIKENNANRLQLISLTKGSVDLISPDYTSNSLLVKHIENKEE